MVQTQDSWGVDYHHRHICAVTGNTVNISATYWHPDWATVQAAHWLRVHRDHYWDVRLIPENLSRVIESCDNRNCILTIRDLRESDAAKYWLSCITDRGKYVNTKVPGVTLSLTGKIITTSSASCPQHHNIIGTTPSVPTVTWLFFDCRSSSQDQCEQTNRWQWSYQAIMWLPVSFDQPASLHLVQE